MSTTSWRGSLLIALALATLAPAYSHDIVPDLADGKFAAGNAARDVQQTAYAGLPTNNFAPPSAPTYVPPANVAPPGGLAPGEVIYSPAYVPPIDWDCSATPVHRTSSWTLGIELMPMQANVTDFEFGRWDEDDSGLGIRGILGYEDPRGFGIRGRFAGFSQESETPGGDARVSLGSFQLDTYKRFFIENDIELALGFGPASGALEFELDDNSHADFEGGGVTMFAETFWPGMRFERSDLGIVARARYNLLFGHWDSNDPSLIPATDGDTMSAVELAWGFEFRRRFGRCDDHHWYIGLLLEYQRWQSDWMSNTAGTSVGLRGFNVNTGLVW